MSRMFTGIHFGNVDPIQAQEYREPLKSVMKKFEVRSLFYYSSLLCTHGKLQRTSHLKLEMFQQVYRDGLQLPLPINNTGFETLSPTASHLHALGKSPTDFSMEPSGGTSSLVVLSSSLASSQPTFAVTSPRASDRPSVLFEGSTRTTERNRPSSLRDSTRRIFASFSHSQSARSVPEYLRS